MKRIVKHLALKVFALFFRNDGPKVVYYHDVGKSYTNMGTPLELLKAHIACARRMGFSFVSNLEELNSPKKLLICFDDGFRGLWDARDYFFQEGVCPTVFIAVDLVGRPGYLTWDEICELQNHGFTFQSHTWSHRSLTEVSCAELKQELFDSRKELERRLGHEVGALCFPRGLFSLRVLKACVEAGFSALFTSVPGDTVQTIDIPGYNGVARLVPRILVQSASVGEFESILHGAMTPLRNRYMSKHFLESDSVEQSGNA